MGKCRSGWAPGDSPQPLGRSLRRAPPQGLSFPIYKMGWLQKWYELFLSPEVLYFYCSYVFNLCFFLPKLWSYVSHSVVSDSLWPHGLLPTRLLCLRTSSGKNTGVYCHSLLQGIFPTQRLNLGLPHCRQILYHLSHWGTKVKLKWFKKLREFPGDPAVKTPCFCWRGPRFSPWSEN